MTAYKYETYPVYSAVSHPNSSKNAAKCWVLLENCAQFTAQRWEQMKRSGLPVDSPWCPRGWVLNDVIDLMLYTYILTKLGLFDLVFYPKSG
jgi:hypothetical protein